MPFPIHQYLNNPTVRLPIRRGSSVFMNVLVQECIAHPGFINYVSCWEMTSLCLNVLVQECIAHPGFINYVSCWEMTSLCRQIKQCPYVDVW